MGKEAKIQIDQQESETPANGGSENLKKENKKRKRSPTEEEQEGKGKAHTNNNNGSQHAAGDGQSKKKKKKTKKQKQAATEEVTEQQTGEEQKKKKKKEKKGKKRTASEESNGVSTKQNGGAGKEEKKKKKKKKAKNNQSGESHSESTLNGHSQTAPAAAATAVEELSESEVKAFHETNMITVSGDGEFSFNPIMSFARAQQIFDQKLRDEVDPNQHKFAELAFITTKKFAKPTPIQSQCWPILLAKRDIIGIAETGSGKTLAFLLPSLLHIKRAQIQNTKRKAQGPTVLVLSPTRELAMQTAEVAQDVGSACGFKSVCIYGGVSKDEQKRTLRGGVEIVVATPGRLIDLVNDKALTLSTVDYLVLDEADRMLDLGFEDDIRKIIGQVKQQRQTLMFSATWPVAIQQLASEFLSSPVKVTIGSEDLAACKRVTQIVEVMDAHARDQRLDQLLREYHKVSTNKIIIFVLYKKEAIRVESMLIRKGWRGIQAIHGDKGQHDRTASLEAFKGGRSPILIATDVAARGLDIPDVYCVINYSFPLTIEDYVHRIGRTGRAGKQGIAHTLFTDFDKARAGELVNVLREAGQTVPERLTKYGTHVKKKEHKLYGAHFKASAGGEAAAAKPTRITFD